MANRHNLEGMLSAYRVLDLTDEKGWMCGKLLGDLGADVIKIERPGGDPGRNIGPFYRDEADPEKSLYWWAFNTSKRGITLDIEKAEGQKGFKRLVQSADILVESFSPGNMAKLGLGYPELEAVNPGIVLVSITPFGQTGPYRDYQSPDIVAWAMGGYMYPFGDVDRAPIRISYHSQAYLHAASEAAAAALLAIYHRELTGEGQWVDVSIQESVARLDMTHKWDMTKVILRRGEWLGPITLKTRYIWPCQDGYVMWQYWVGPAATLWVLPFLQWMEEEGMLDDYMKNANWATIDASTEEGIKAIEELMDHTEGPTLKFFQAHSKAELNEEARQRGLMLYPVSDAKDVLESEQLAARAFWQTVNHPELGVSLTYPGAFARGSEPEATPRIPRRAPLIGEHNEEIYVGELGFSQEELDRLRQSAVI